MDAPLHAWDQGTVQTMSCQREICTEKHEDRSISPEGYGDYLIRKEESSSTIWKRVKQSQVHTIHRLNVWKPSCKENVHEWPAKKFFSVRITRQLTQLQL